MTNKLPVFESVTRLRRFSLFSLNPPCNTFALRLPRLNSRHCFATHEWINKPHPNKHQYCRLYHPQFLLPRGYHPDAWQLARYHPAEVNCDTWFLCTRSCPRYNRPAVLPGWCGTAGDRTRPVSLVQIASCRQDSWRTGGHCKIPALLLPHSPTKNTNCKDRIIYTVTNGPQQFASEEYKPTYLGHDHVLGFSDGLSLCFHQGL